MLSFLDPSPKPICIELEASELIVSVHRLADAFPRRLLRSAKDGRTLSRWRLTTEQRVAIAAGADVFVETWADGWIPRIKVAISESIDAGQLAADYGIALERKAKA